jgi:hypothetical protein
MAPPLSSGTVQVNVKVVLVVAAVPNTIELGIVADLIVVVGEISDSPTSLIAVMATL